MSQDLGHAFVHEAAFEREEKQMLSFARPKLFHQKTVLARQGTQSFLNFQQGLQSKAFGRLFCGLFCRNLTAQAAAQFRGQRHAAALPRRHLPFVARAAAHLNRHIADSNKLEQATGQIKGVARIESGGKPFFNMAKQPAALKGHGQQGLAANGSDVHAVPLCNALAKNADSALAKFGFLEFFVLLQAAASGKYKLQAFLVRFFIDVLKTGCSFYFVPSGRWFKTLGNGEGAQVLNQYIVAKAVGFNDFHGTLLHGLAQGCALQNFQGMGGHKVNCRSHSGLMSRTPGTLNKARNAFGAAHLNHHVDGAKIYPQVKAAGADHHF